MGAKFEGFVGMRYHRGKEWITFFARCGGDCMGDKKYSSAKFHLPASSKVAEILERQQKAVLVEIESSS